MKKYLLFFLLTGSLLFSKPSVAQTVDSVAMAQSQQRMESDLKDAKKHQRKIDKSQKKIKSNRKKSTGRKEEERKKMKKIEKEQRKADKG